MWCEYLPVPGWQCEFVRVPIPVSDFATVLWQCAVKRIPPDGSCKIQWCDMPQVYLGITTESGFYTVQTSDAYGPDPKIQGCIYSLSSDVLRGESKNLSAE
jgi:hypothetical protein